MHIDSIFTFFLIAVALAMDAFAVSVSSGIIIPNLRLRNALKIALFFSIFQAVMPVIGWLAGTGLKDFIQAVDHYIAFGLLAVIGIKMIYEAFKKREAEQSINPLNFGVLLILSVATSIDALAVGLSFALLSIKILTPVIIIGITGGLGVYAGQVCSALGAKEVIGIARNPEKLKRALDFGATHVISSVNKSTKDIKDEFKNYCKEKGVPSKEPHE